MKITNGDEKCSGIYEEISRSADEKYKEFQSKLLPTIEENRILGVRSPVAKKIARKYANTDEGNKFMDELPHKYYDENVVHAFMLCSLEVGEEEMVKKLTRFLPFMDNWAVCDGLCANLKSFFKDKEKRLDFVLSCIDLSVYGDIPTCFLSPASTTYTIRFGLVSLLAYYVEEKYLGKIFDVCKDIAPLCGENPRPADYSYYVSMAVAWLISTCLIKEYDLALPLIKSKEIPKWIHNKSIQKACESCQIDGDKKAYIKTLKK